MIQVPESNPLRQPFAPDAEYGQNYPQSSPHTLAIPKRGDDAHKDAFLMSGADESGAPRDTPERAAIRARNAMFDDANLRAVMTALHEEGDAFERRLLLVRGKEIGNIRKLAESFLREKESGLSAELPNNRQKTAFSQFFAAYGEELLHKAGVMQEWKTREYRSEVTERQNGVFMNEALKPVNLFDDGLQTRLRDMCLFNLDNQYADAPDAARREAMDEFSRDYYLRILDKRLESDPARTRVMLDAPAVRRVLGGERLKEFEARVERAVEDDAMRARCREWARSDLAPEEAKSAIDKAYPEGEDRKAAREHYAHYRYNRNRDEAIALVEKMERAWSDLKANGIRRGTIPDAVRRRDPGLYAFLDAQIKRRQENGGAAPSPDLGFLLDKASNFAPRAAAESLRGAKKLYDAVDRLGGPDSPATGAFLRLFSGTSTKEDKAWLDDLRHALDEAEKCLGQPLSEDEAARFLAGFDGERSILLERNRTDGMSGREARELAREIIDRSLFSGHGEEPQG